MRTKVTHRQTKDGQAVATGEIADLPDDHCPPRARAGARSTAFVVRVRWAREFGKWVNVL